MYNSELIVFRCFIELTSPIDLPDQFTLVEEDKQHRCAVVWRKERRVGVAFY
jgi:hypothetical protein